MVNLRNLTVAGLSMIACACATVDPRPFSGVDEDLVQYVEYFEKITGVSLGGVSVGFEDLRYKYGVCTVQGRYRWVSIDKNSFYGFLTEDEKTILLLHELGHCVGGLDHKNTDLTDGCEGSIMYPYLVSQFCWDRHEEIYLNNFVNEVKRSVGSFD